MVKPVDEDSRGILDPAGGLQRFSLDRVPPDIDVGRFVAWYWLGRWDLPPGERHTQAVLAHPVVNLVVTPEEGGVVHGVQRTLGERVLEGRSWVVGTMFRPGGFRPFVDLPMSTLTDRSLPIGAVFGPPGDRLAADVVGAGGGADGAALVEAFLAERVPAGPHVCERVTEVAEAMAADPGTARVEDVASAQGYGVRHLQRLFAEHVGVNPKWVLRRYRLYEAAETAARGSHIDWAALAATLGYADQSHLIRDFTAAIGEPPDRYARRTQHP